MMVKLQFKDNLIVTDSSSITEKNIESIYGIIALSGPIEKIRNVSGLFKGKFFNEELTLSTFEKWMENLDNQVQLLSIFTSLYLDSQRCSFYCYISDHVYSIFLYVIRIFFPNLNYLQPLVQQELDKLYSAIDKEILSSCLLKKEINAKGLYTIISNTIEPKEYATLYDEMNNNCNIDKFQQGLSILSVADLSLFDYVNYSPILVKFDDIQTVLATSHSYDGMKFYRNMNQMLNNKNECLYELEKIGESTKDFDVSFLNKLMIIVHYIWNRFHFVDSVSELNETEKLLIVTIWMLFQSQKSGWMFSIEDFRKLKQLLEEMKGK